ncbi:hypothetical protein GCM10010399_70830 [Dactylosporangium fulvum]
MDKCATIGHMNAVKILLATAALILVGIVAWWLIKMLFGAVFYLIVGALVVGGGWYLYNKIKRTDPWRVRR